MPPSKWQLPQCSAASGAMSSCQFGRAAGGASPVVGVGSVVAVSVGLSASMVTALGLPVTALLSSAALLPPRLLPLAVLGSVAAFVVHLLADRLAPPQAAAGAALQHG